MQFDLLSGAARALVNQTLGQPDIA